MVEEIRTWVARGSFWRHLLLHMVCQTPTIFLLYIWRDTLFGL